MADLGLCVCRLAGGFVSLLSSYSSGSRELPGLLWPWLKHKGAKRNTQALSRALGAEAWNSHGDTVDLTRSTVDLVRSVE